MHAKSQCVDSCTVGCIGHAKARILERGGLDIACEVTPVRYVGQVLLHVYTRLKFNLRTKSLAVFSQGENGGWLIYEDHKGPSKQFFMLQWGGVIHPKPDATYAIVFRPTLPD
jgi:hypothetical protein